jgi:hypothetical protein
MEALTHLETVLEVAGFRFDDVVLVVADSNQTCLMQMNFASKSVESLIFWFRTFLGVDRDSLETLVVLDIRQVTISASASDASERQPNSKSDMRDKLMVQVR